MLRGAGPLPVGRLASSTSISSSVRDESGARSLPSGMIEHKELASSSAPPAALGSGGKRLCSALSMRSVRLSSKLSSSFTSCPAKEARKGELLCSCATELSPHPVLDEHPSTPAVAVVTRGEKITDVMRVRRSVHGSSLLAGGTSLVEMRERRWPGVSALASGAASSSVSSASVARPSSGSIWAGRATERALWRMPKHVQTSGASLQTFGVALAPPPLFGHVRMQMGRDKTTRGSESRTAGVASGEVLQPPVPGGSARGAMRGGLHTVGNYTLLEVVGQGTFGEVWSAVERHTRESVAVKILEKEKIVDEDARQRLVNEIAILQRVSHNNLVQLLEVIDEGERIYLVTEYVGGGELFSYIVQKGRLDENEAARLFAQMVAAVDSCHRQLIIHRDLKPENVLLDANGDIKVIDFGLGTLLDYNDEVLTVACGSPHYAAPEMLLGGGYLGQRADMWSLGVCLYAMVCGCLPFDEPEMEVLYDRIIAGEYDFSPAPHLSSAARDLITGLLRSPPEERLTAREVLSHKWMRLNNSHVPSGPLALSVGLIGAVVDPACRQLVRKMEAEYGIPQREVIEGLRRGERSPLTATYWLLRNREVRKGSIQRYAAHLPRPPPARAPTQRRRPVPSHIRAAAAKLPAVSAAQPAPTSLGGGPISARASARQADVPLSAIGAPGSSCGHTSGGHGVGHGLSHGSPPHPTTSPYAASSPYAAGAHRAPRYEEGKPTGPSPKPLSVQRPREEAPLFVHASGALSDRTDRDGHSRRLHELESGPARRGPSGREPHARTPATGAPNSHLTHLSELNVTGQGRTRPPSGGMSSLGGAMAALGFRGASSARDSNSKTRR